MSSYIPVPVETDPPDLAQEAFDYLAAQVVGWTPSPGNLESWLIEALSQIASELRALVALVPESIFAFFGSSILGFPPYPATQAQCSTTWTAIDTAGYTIDAGTVIAITPPASALSYAFQVDSDAVIPTGSSSLAGVSCHALEAGSLPSGQTGNVVVIDPLTFVSTVTLDGPTSGGVDAESVDAYLSRLSALLTLLTPRPILPQDFAILAQRMVPGVARAVAIDLYNPGPPVDANCPRCVSVVIVDENGNPCAADVKAEVDTLLQSSREVNFLVFVLDPTYTTIDVSFDVQSYPGFDPVDVADRVAAQLRVWLSPGAWGVPPFGDTSGRSWINDTKVRYLEAAEQVNRVEGVHYINTLAIGHAATITATYDYGYQTNNTAPPGDKSLRLNSSTMASVTQIYIDDEDEHGTSRRTALLAITAGSTLTVVSDNNPANIASFNVTSVTGMTGYVQFVVTHVSHAGTIQTGPCTLRVAGSSGGALGQADLTLTGVAPLPEPGSISGVAHAEA